MGRPSLFGREVHFDGEGGRLGRACLGRTWGFLGLIQAALLLAFATSFVFRIDGERFLAVSDDIYISACYARNIAAGHGPVWFPGAAPVEGFSNPLWTLMLALFHRLPFFRESHLGIYVLVVQLAVLAAALRTALLVSRRLLDLAGGALDPSVWRLVAIVVLSLGWASLGFWLAEGFEIGLVLALALLAFAIALRDRPGIADPAWIGALAGLCLWTRMDGPLYCAAAFLLLLRKHAERPRRLAVAASVLFLFAGALFGVRWTVFGDWMPNTYWLKLSGWPLADRLATGWKWNRPLAPSIAAAWILFASPPLRRALGRAHVPALALLATATLGVVYSIHNGGDSWTLRLGFDRFSAPGAVMLGVALALFTLRAGATPARRAGTAAVAIAIAIAPVLLDPSLVFVANLLRGKFTASERTFISYGRALEDCSRPGARILTGAAGAIVYFSHREGSDFLGKCDPWVARQPVNRPDLTSGHNKRYAPEIFRRDRPEFSREPPPPDLAGEYRECGMRGHRVWVRRDGRNVLWDRLTPASD